MPRPLPTPSAGRAGQIVRDGKNVHLGTVDRVSDAGVRIIFTSRFVTLLASSVSVAEGKVNTSLTKAEVSKLH
jgi:hypothetical protein